MKSSRSKILPAWCCLSGLLATFPIISAHAQLYVGAPDEGVWPNYFRLGVLAGLNLKADFSMNGQFTIASSQVGATGVSGVNHIYDDGYVRVDQTGNAQGYSSFWGYNSASQVSGNTISMHSAKSFTANGGNTTADQTLSAGLDLAYGGHLFPWNGAHVGWEFGFGFLPVNIEDNQSFAGVVTRTVHSFNTAGIVLPSAPYNGGNSGLGPTIRDTATALPDDTLNATVNGKRSLDVDVYIFRLGPTLFWDLNPRWAVSVSAGPAVGLVSGDLEFNETLSLSDGSTAINSGKISGTDVIFGGYLNGTILFHVEEHGDFYLSAQYMPMSKTSISDTGRQATLNLSGGLFISAGVNWPF